MSSFAQKYISKCPVSLSGGFSFLERVIWAVQAVRVGYRWNLGYDNSIKIWEDKWIADYPLATRFMIYIICVMRKNILFLRSGMGRS